MVEHDLSIPAIEVSSKEFRLPVEKFITAKDMTNKEVDHIGNDFCFLVFCQGKTELLVCWSQFIRLSAFGTGVYKRVVTLSNLSLDG